MNATTGARFQHAFPLWVLVSVAVSFPVYSLLKAHPAFVAAHQFDRVDLLSLIGLVAILIPAIAVALWALGRKLSAWIGQGIAALILLLAVALIVLGALSDRPLSAPFALGIAITAAIAFLIAYWRWPIVATFVRWYALVLPVMLALFLLAPGIRPFLSSASESLTSTRVSDQPMPDIVLVIFDELPLISLLRQSETANEVGLSINSERFPNLAELAAQATWYPWHSSNSDTTSIAIPTLLSGRLPGGREIIPSWQDVPVNLYTALADHYRMNVFENGTHLCPSSLCRSHSVLSERSGRWALMLDDLWISLQHRVVPQAWRHRLIPIDNRWMAFRNPVSEPSLDSGSFSKDHYDFSDRGDVFRRFIEQTRSQVIGEQDRPSLNVIHSMLPHAPFKRLPEGWFYTLPEDSQFLGTLSKSAEASFLHQLYDDPQAMLLARQQHLMQLGFADTLIGEMMDALTAEKALDHSMIIVTADHGASFTPGYSRRQIHEGNQAEIASIPLLIRYPGQREAVIATHASQAIDLLPTILDTAGLQLEAPVDGQSLRAESLDRDLIRIQAGAYRQETMTLDAFSQAITRTLNAYNQRDTMGSLDGLFGHNRLNAPEDWVGQSIQVIPVGAVNRAPALKVAQLEALRDWSPAESHRLSLLYAEHADEVSTSSLPEAVVLSINGTVACLARYLRMPGFERQTRCLFDHRLLNPGQNSISVYPMAQRQDHWVRGEALDLIAVDQVRGTRAPSPRSLRQIHLSPLALTDLHEVGNPEINDHLWQGWARDSGGAIRWTVAESATLRQPLPEPAVPGDYQLTLRAKVLTEPQQLEAQRVRIRVNQGDWIEQRWDAPGFVEYLVPWVLSEPTDELQVEFMLPDAASPKSLGMGEDGRTLGFALISWRITPLDKASDP